MELINEHLCVRLLLKLWIARIYDQMGAALTSSGRLRPRHVAPVRRPSAAGPDAHAAQSQSYHGWRSRWRLSNRVQAHLYALAFLLHRELGTFKSLAFFGMADEDPHAGLVRGDFPNQRFEWRCFLARGLRGLSSRLWP